MEHRPPISIRVQNRLQAISTVDIATGVVMESDGLDAASAREVVQEVADRRGITIEAASHLIVDLAAMGCRIIWAEDR
jgi:AmiR/NasT family two-component response regulator